jgi:glycosyltransferase involved in cell wall biosynthesis
VTTVHFVVPNNIDDPAQPSGGNIYDSALLAALPAFGWTVRRHRVGTSLRDTLRAVPEGAVVVVDGLLGCADPRALHDAARRLRMVLLVHMPAGLNGAPRPDTANEAAALSAAGAVIATSNWTRHVLRARHGSLAARVRVAQPGVEPAPHAPGTPAGGQLLFVGAIVAHKGLDVLVRALADVRDLTWECVCVGSLECDPGYVTAVRLLLDEHSLGSRVHLVGAADRDVVAKYYAAADALAAPSRVEAYGMVISEALARGLPVLAAAAGGMAEPMGGAADQPGLSVRSGDVAAWSVALRSWLTDAALRQSLRERAALRRTSLPSWSATAARVSDVLAELAGA